MKNANETKKLKAGTYTVCLDTNKASADTYQNWLTLKVVRLSKGTYDVFRLSNRDGNGQCWELQGTVFDTIQVWFQNDNPLHQMVGTLFASHFGLTWRHALSVGFPKARIWNVSRMKTRKTAAPSLLRPTRDKNVKQRRWNAIDIHSMHRKEV